MPLSASNSSDLSRGGGRGVIPEGLSLVRGAALRHFIVYSLLMIEDKTEATRTGRSTEKLGRILDVHPLEPITQFQCLEGLV